MTAGEAIGTNPAATLDEIRSLQRALKELWPELFWAELIPGLDEAPEERLRVALIRPLTKNGDS